MVFVLALLACARVSSPTGGDVDETAPVALNTNPPPFSIYFDKSYFEYEFDEYVQIKDFSTQLIISPPLPKSPEYSLKGKRLRIFWEGALRDSTTYQFNFGKAVTDNNEGNIANDLVYVFSTGDYIDSLAIKGKVLASDNNKGVDKAFVMIYRDHADSLPLTTRPDYFALSDASGSFSIRYLPKGKFKIFVLKEENNDYIYNGPPETIAFLDSSVMSVAIDSAQFVKLRAFVEKDTSQYIASVKNTDYGYYESVFNVSAEGAAITFTDPESGTELKALSQMSVTQDTLMNWVELPDRDDFDEVHVRTRAPNMPADTSFWYIERQKQYREKAQLLLKPNTARSKLNPEMVFSLFANNPIQEIDSSLIYFLEDSLVVYPTHISRSKMNREISFSYPFNAESNYTFYAKAGAFRGLFGTYSDSLSIPFSLQPLDYYGNLEVKISIIKKADRGSAKILQLLSPTKKVIASRTFTDKLKTSFTQLEPGAYGLKVIFDDNNNGEWDTGSYSLNRQPERLSIYSETIDIRSNWDFEVEWIPTTPSD